MNLKQQLELLENRVRFAYQDSKGLWTIGVGRLIDKRRGGGLSDAEIDLLLDNDVREKTAAVLKALPWVKDLNEPRQAVVIGMAFQMGIGEWAQSGLLSFTNTLDHMRCGRYTEAKLGMLASKWARTDSPNRARMLAAQMETGLWQTPNW